MVACGLLVFSMLGACADNDSATYPAMPMDEGGPMAADGETPDGATLEGATLEGAAEASDTSFSDDAAPSDDVATSDAATSDATSAPSDAGPGGDGGLILGGDGAAADGTFQLQNPTQTNLLSWSDVHATCSTVAGATTGTYVMTCQEGSAGVSPCRTVVVTFVGNPPAQGQVYPAVAKATPAANEATVVYQESIDCSLANTNGWSQPAAGGDFTVTTHGDTAILFELHDVALGSAPPDRGITNQNAAGTFILAGSGFSPFPFD